MIYFAKFLNILGILPLKLENHNGILLLRKSTRLQSLFYLRFVSCFFYCFYLFCRTAQFATNSQNFSHLEGILLVCWVITNSLVFVFLINTFLHIADLATFWNQISKFYHSNARFAADAGEGNGELCIQTGFILKVSIAIGLASTLFNCAAVWVFTQSPRQPMYVSSVVLSEEMDDHSCLLLIPLAVHELLHYVENWYTIILYILLLFGYFVIMAAWLDKLR